MSDLPSEIHEDDETDDVASGADDEGVEEPA